MERLAQCVIVACAVWMAPAVAHAANYNICAFWTVDTIDSGVGEDYFTGGNNGIIVAARYPAVRVTAIGYDTGVIAANSVGCFTITGAPSSGTFTVYAYTQVRDPDGNLIRMHGGSATDFSASPAGTYYWTINSSTMSSTSTNIFYFGGYSERSTMISMLGEAHVRNQSWMDLSDKTIQVADDCFPSSAHYKDSSTPAVWSYDAVSSGRTYVNIASDTAGCSFTDWRRRKFLVAHELGHAEMLLTTQKNEPNVNNNFPVPTSDTACHLTPPGQAPNTGYGMESQEWNSVGAREGFGHFYATTAFNDAYSAGGKINWLGKTQDVEVNNPPNAGGWHVNNCDTWSYGAGVNLDWLRTYWDYATPLGSSGVSLQDVRDMYWVVMLNHPTGYSLSAGTYYGGFAEALDILGNSAHESRWAEMGCWNGTDKQVGYETTSCY